MGGRRVTVELPAFEVRSPSDEVLLSLSRREVALIGRYLLVQAQEWEAGQ